MEQVSKIWIMQYMLWDVDMRRYMFKHGALESRMDERETRYQEPHGFVADYISKALGTGRVKSPTCLSPVCCKRLLPISRPDW